MNIIEIIDGGMVKITHEGNPVELPSELILFAADTIRESMGIKTNNGKVDLIGLMNKEIYRKSKLPKKDKFTPEDLDKWAYVLGVQKESDETEQSFYERVLVEIAGE